MKSMNAAVQILAALNAYCPRVTVVNPEVFERERLAAKRRKRPMSGRGKYGAGLMVHFAVARAQSRK